jgi:hypothetical protein
MTTDVVYHTTYNLVFIEQLCHHLNALLRTADKEVSKSDRFSRTHQPAAGRRPINYHATAVYASSLQW